MPPKKKERIQCIYFSCKMSKREISEWYKENKKKYGFGAMRNFKLKKLYGDYILIIRPRYRFKTCNSTKTGLTKLVKGYLK